MPVNQFESTHLKMMQLASGTSAQPFKTEKDYRNFLKRMELYVVWLDSAMLYMEKGIQQRVVLPKALTEKLIPQFEEQITTNVEDNLFYSTIKTFPKEFSEETKSTLKKRLYKSNQRKTGS